MRQVLSHKISISVVYQVDTDLNSAPVLGLRPLNKSFRVHQSSHHHQPWVYRFFFTGVGSQGVIGMELVSSSG